MLLSRRITIIAGHYGSGKTEFAVNLALSAAKSAQVTLADLDIVNPYFCSREREEELADAGVTLIAPAKSTHHADVPALPPEMARIFADQDRFSIIDAGGDDAGARVLGRYRPQFDAANPDLWIVLNANRPQTSSPEQALALLRRIEAACSRRCTGVVNNTHLCGMTRPEDVLKGAALTQQVAKDAKVPVVCHLASQEIFTRISPDALSGKRFPIAIRMKKPWE